MLAALLQQSSLTTQRSSVGLCTCDQRIRPGNSDQWHPSKTIRCRYTACAGDHRMLVVEAERFPRQHRRLRAQAIAKGSKTAPVEWTGTSSKDKCNDPIRKRRELWRTSSRRCVMQHRRGEPSRTATFRRHTDLTDIARCPPRKPSQALLLRCHGHTDITQLMPQTRRFGACGVFLSAVSRRTALQRV
ncbi:MAG: hypothetical protein CM15mP38_0080 [Synechococcus sp.]|nr:MAG: hypothetical protein CM15mP38_0080 [Synechococcus sp.]